jgi:outer membrane protein assembly factor BamB
MLPFRPVLALLLVVSLSACVPADDWPQFRGPGGQGHAPGAGWPLRWSEQENIAWKMPIPGRGWSSPVVVGARIWLTAALDTPAAAEVVQRVLERKGQDVPAALVAGHLTLKALAFDLNSGRLLRDVTLFEIDEPVVICSSNSYASPTPVVEAGRVVCDFGTMGTACLDAETGRVVWSRRFVADHQVGPGSSPVAQGRLLFLLRDGIDEQYVTAVDQATGATVWKTERPSLAATSPSFRKAFSTPLLFRAAGRDQLVAVGARWIVSYEPQTGRELWRIDTGGSFSNISRPVFGGGLLFAGTSYPNAVLRAIGTDGSGDVTATHVLWEQPRFVPRTPSPLLVDGQIYLIADNGIASCLDALTGKVQWTERVGGSYSASPVFADGRIYCFSENGRTTIIRSGRQYERLRENRLDGHILASPAFVNHTLVLRTDQYLYRIAQPTVK